MYAGEQPGKASWRWLRPAATRACFRRSPTARGSSTWVDFCLGISFLSCSFGSILRGRLGAVWPRSEGGVLTHEDPACTHGLRPRRPCRVGRLRVALGTLGTVAGDLVGGVVTWRCGS